MIWYFICVYIINRTLHGRLEIRNVSSRVEKYFTRSLRSLVKYFSTLEENFRISARSCNILYLKIVYFPFKITKKRKNELRVRSFTERFEKRIPDLISLLFTSRQPSSIPSLFMLMPTKVCVRCISEAINVSNQSSLCLSAWCLY